MTEKRSIFESLMHRRVPQLVGMYIAATWLVIELGDWMTERFNLPAILTSYVFVAMLAMNRSTVKSRDKNANLQAVRLYILTFRGRVLA